MKPTRRSTKKEGNTTPKVWLLYVCSISWNALSMHLNSGECACLTILWEQFGTRTIFMKSLNKHRSLIIQSTTLYVCSVVVFFKLGLFSHPEYTYNCLQWCQIQLKLITIAIFQHFAHHKFNQTFTCSMLNTKEKI